jgi:hypothetical protein
MEHLGENRIEIRYPRSARPLRSLRFRISMPFLIEFITRSREFGRWGSSRFFEAGVLNNAVSYCNCWWDGQKL